MKLDLYGWFPQENADTLAKLIKEHNIKTVIEIGCFLGLSTKFFVEQGCTVISIDTFEGSKDLNGSQAVKDRLPNLYEQFLFNLKELGIEDKVKVMRMTSSKAYQEMHDYAHEHGLLTDDLSADLVFIDGSHEYDDVRVDISLWNKMADKIICGDDYTDVHPGVKRAVDELLPEANKNQRLWYQIKN